MRPDTKCCLTHNLAGVGTITWPRVLEPPQGIDPFGPLPTARYKHNLAESAESEAYRGRECRLPGLPPVVRHIGPSQTLANGLDQDLGGSSRGHPGIVFLPRPLTVFRSHAPYTEFRKTHKGLPNFGRPLYGLLR
jgi:hypothetical protein